MSRQRKRDSDLLPYISPRSESRKRSQSNASSRGCKNRSTSAPSKKRTRPISSLSSNYDEDDEDEVEYLDDDGRPIPKDTDRSKGSLDTRQFYALDTAALRKYTMEVAKLNQRKHHESPYLVSQVPLPPKSPRSERTPRSARRYRSACDHGRLLSPSPMYLQHQSTAPSKDQTYLHPRSPPRTVQGQQQTKCVIELMYLGSNLHLVREQFDRRQEILVEQQHCGGNTLVVFKDKLEAGESFSFSSHRHIGYPFALTIYVDGKTDCRVSTCCEYRHQGRKLFGRNGHFSFQKVSNASPCYKCRVENSLKKKHTKTKTPRKKKSDSVDQGHDEVDQGQGRTATPPSSDNKEEENKNHLIVPVENEETNGNKYDDDFDSSSRSSSRSSGSRSKSRSRSRSHDSSGSSRSSSKSDRKDSKNKQLKYKLRRKTDVIVHLAHLKQKTKNNMSKSTDYPADFHSLSNANNEEYTDASSKPGFCSRSKEKPKPKKKKMNKDQVDLTDTADEVSEIESEIASPRNSEMNGNKDSDAENKDSQSLSEIRNNAAQEVKGDYLKPSMPRRQPSIVISTSDGKTEEILEFNEGNVYRNCEQDVFKPEAFSPGTPVKEKEKIPIKKTAPEGEKKLAFEEKCITIPMARSGQNRYINKQKKRDARNKKKMQVPKDNEEINQKGPKDLSPRENVIRGYPGDSSDDGDICSLVIPADSSSPAVVGLSEVHQTVEMENSLGSEKIPSFSILVSKARKKKEEVKMTFFENHLLYQTLESENGDSKSLSDSIDAQKDPLSQHSLEASLDKINFHHNLEVDDNFVKAFPDQRLSYNQQVNSQTTGWDLVNKESGQVRCEHELNEIQAQLEIIEVKLKGVAIIDSQAVTPVLSTSGLESVLKDDFLEGDANSHNAVPSQNIISRGDTALLSEYKDSISTDLNFFTKTDQNIECFNHSTRITRVRSLSRESERYVQNSEALQEPPVINTNILIHPAHGFMVSQEDGSTKAVHESQPLMLSVLHPGEMYHMAESKQEEPQQGSETPDSESARLVQNLEVKGFENITKLGVEQKGVGDENSWEDLQVLRQITSFVCLDQDNASTHSLEGSLDMENNEEIDQHMSEFVDLVIPPDNKVNNKNIDNSATSTDSEELSGEEVGNAPPTFVCEIIDVSDNVQRPHDEHNGTNIDTNFLYPRRLSITEPQLMDRLVQKPHNVITAGLSMEAQTIDLNSKSQVVDVVQSHHQEHLLNSHEMKPDNERFVFTADKHDGRELWANGNTTLPQHAGNESNKMDNYQNLEVHTIISEGNVNGEKLYDGNKYLDREEKLYGGKKYLDREEKPNDGKKYISKEEKIYDGNKYLDSEEKLYDGNKYLDSEEKLYDGNKYISTEEKLYDGNKYLDSEEKLYDGNKYLDSEEKLYDGNKYLDSDEKSYDGNKYLDSKEKLYDGNKYLDSEEKLYDGNKYLDSEDKLNDGNKYLDTEKKLYDGNKYLDSEEKPYDGKKYLVTEEKPYDGKKYLDEEDINIKLDCNELIDSKSDVESKSICMYEEDKHIVQNNGHFNKEDIQNISSGSESSTIGTHTYGRNETQTQGESDTFCGDLDHHVHPDSTQWFKTWSTQESQLINSNSMGIGHFDEDGSRVIQYMPENDDYGPEFLSSMEEISQLSENDSIKALIACLEEQITTDEIK